MKRRTIMKVLGLLPFAGGLSAKPARASFEPDESEEGISYVWLARTGPEDFERQLQSKGSAIWWNCPLQRRFQEGIEESEAKLRRRGLQPILEGPFHFMFRQGEEREPWGGLAWNEPLHLENAGIIFRDRRWGTILRAFDLRRRALCSELMTPKTGMSFRAYDELAEKRFGWPTEVCACYKVCKLPGFAG